MIYLIPPANEAVLRQYHQYMYSCFWDNTPNLRFIGVISEIFRWYHVEESDTWESHPSRLAGRGSDLLLATSAW